MDNFPAWVDFGRDICADLSAAEEREWLVTNGRGGFACGTVAGLLTRRYHGLLIASLEPFSARTLLVSKLDESAEYDGRSYPLFTNRWAGGTVDPHGYRHLERFRLEGTTPVWTFACADALVEKRVWMQPQANTTYARYDLVRGRGPVELTLKALVNYRDFHSVTQAGDWRMRIERHPRGLRVIAFEGAIPFYLLSASAAAEPEHDWYLNFDLAAERSRGLEDREDHLLAGTFRARLEPGGSATIVASTEPSPELDGQVAYAAQAAHERSLLARWERAFPRQAATAPDWVRQLVLAAHQFIVTRRAPGNSEGRSVIAGYPWFDEWGRDTMIALPGLMLCTGRPDVARSLLRTYAGMLDRGMLPNQCPRAGLEAEYNTVDAALWFIEATRQYLNAAADEQLLAELFPALEEIVAWHARGTRYSIQVDPADGLLHAGEPGVQLTWMDAKIGAEVVTPRIGKPVEINALWYQALVSMAAFARRLKKPAADYEAMAQRAHRGFQRFWNEAAGYCFDVIDGPNGNDLSLRPNQILAVALSASPLTGPQQRAVVEACTRHLLAPYGLRSLSASHPDYHGYYGGYPRQRDASYHQGTVWGWLIGPFVLAHLRVYGDSATPASFLEPFGQHLRAYGLGTSGEIFDGDPPFAPRGCIAQAWTVAEVLRAWAATHNF